MHKSTDYRNGRVQQTGWQTDSPTCRLTRRLLNTAAAIKLFTERCSAEARKANSVERSINRRYRNRLTIGTIKSSRPAGFQSALPKHFKGAEGRKAVPPEPDRRHRQMHRTQDNKSPATALVRTIQSIFVTYASKSSRTANFGELWRDFRTVLELFWNSFGTLLKLFKLPRSIYRTVFGQSKCATDVHDQSSMLEML